MKAQRSAWYRESTHYMGLVYLVLFARLYILSANGKDGLTVVPSLFSLSSLPGSLTFQGVLSLDAGPGYLSCKESQCGPQVLWW